MTDKIKIDIVSDVVCPWCTIGYKRLDKAITEMGIQDQVEIEWQPFELNPHMPKEGQNLQEHITEKYGSSLEDQKRSQEYMAEAGAELGFTFDYFDEMRMANTFEAHILLEYAKAFGKQTDLKMRLTTAFFSERKDVSDRAILKQALLDVGLPDTYANQVYKRMLEARPNLRVIVCSGYAVDGPVQEILDAGAQDFMQKPFSFVALSAKLKEILEIE